MGMFENDPPGYTPRRPLLRERRGKPFVPPQLFERSQCRIEPYFSIQHSIQHSAFSIQHCQGAKHLSHAPRLGDTATRHKGLLGIEDLADRSNAGIDQVRLESFEDAARTRAIVWIHLEP